MRKHKKAIISVSVILVVILGIGAFSYITVNTALNKMPRVDDTVEMIPREQEDFETDVADDTGLEVIAPEDVEWEPYTAETPIGESSGNSGNSGNSGKSGGGRKLLNFLLVGQDRRPGEGRQRSDTMILISINTKTKQVSMISFLRDLYVQIPGYTDNRLNAAYVFGGFPLLKKALYINFGISVDGCFEVDFVGFTALIDQIGGVDVSLTAAEANRIGKGTREGMNHLNGAQALAYARIRKIDSDFQRTNRQRTVLLAAFDKVKTLGVTEIIQLLDAALPFLTTDMTNADIYSTAIKLLPMVTSVSIKTYHIPPDGTYRPVYIRKMAVLYPDLAAIRKILQYQYLPL